MLMRVCENAEKELENALLSETLKKKMARRGHMSKEGAQTARWALSIAVDTVMIGGGLNCPDKRANGISCMAILYMSQSLNSFI